MKTAEETLLHLVERCTNPQQEWSPAIADALRQLCEEFEREVIGEDVKPYIDPFMGDTSISGRDVYNNNIKAIQRAKLRAFCGVGEQPSAVDDEWIDQQIEWSDES